MTGLSGIIDPPGPFAGRTEWLAFIAEVEKLPASPEIAEALRDARAMAELAPDNEPDDFADLE